jgi:hypothetical protein
MMSSRGKIQLNHRSVSEVSDEPGLGLVPHGARQRRDVDVAAESARGPESVLASVSSSLVLQGGGQTFSCSRWSREKVMLWRSPTTNR